jgi:hypothetical protein
MKPDAAIAQLDELIVEGRRRVAIADAYINMGRQLLQVATDAGNAVEAHAARSGLSQAEATREREQGLLDLAILHATVARTNPDWFATAAI